MVTFTKMHSAGNDFVVLREPAGADLPALARQLCRRRYGVGADGIMVLSRAAEDAYRVRMFNPDGSEDTCGNGTLCIALYLWQEALVHQTAFSLETLTGSKEVRVQPAQAAPTSVSVNMGRADFSPAAIPAAPDSGEILSKRLDIDGVPVVVSSVSTGTPHTVIFTDALPGDREFRRLAPRIEFHPLFPEQTSVSWGVVEAQDRVRVRVWERGAVGESLGCGTGACAIAAIGRRLGLLANRVTVASKGGELGVAFDERDGAWLTGRPVRVFEGVLPMDAAAD